MARAPQKPQPHRPTLTPDQTRQVIDRLKRRIAELEAFDPTTVKTRYRSPELMALQASIDETLSAVFGHGTVEYYRYARAASLDHGPRWVYTSAGQRPEDNPTVFRGFIETGKLEAVALLRQAICGLEEEIASPSSQPASTEHPHRSQKAFVVHGHDEAALQALARFLEQLGLIAIILREQPDQGRTIIEKFENCAAEVGFAVVLLTPDDVGSAATQDHVGRARQNVVFELGYFAGKLGRGRACLLLKRGVEIPSDLYGVIYTEMDEGDGWKLKLVRELKAAKLDFDVNRVLG